MSNAQYSKEEIKARMYSRISALWDVRSVDRLDPVVKLLVESLSSEIFGLSAKLDGFEDNVAGKLTRAFNPPSMIAASPAHALLHARADRGGTTVDTNTEFAYKEPRFAKKHGLHKLTMTPVVSTRIFDADVVALIAANRFWSVSPGEGKTLLATSTVRSPIFNSTVWIGVEAGSDVRDLNGMSFWFDFPQMDDPAGYVRLLEYGKWSHGGAAVSTSSGLPESDDAEKRPAFGVYDWRGDMLEEIKWKYNDRFVSVSGDLPVKNLKKEKVPGELAGMFDAELTNGLSDGTIWFKVVLPPAFDDDGLDGLVAHTNCFPIANIYTKSHSAVTRLHSPIVELQVERNEHFLFVRSVRDSAGREYREAGTRTDNADLPAYAVRGGLDAGYASLDTRSFVDKVLDLYNEESIAFSGFGIDIADTAEKIMGCLSVFRKRSQSGGGDDSRRTYLILSGGAKRDIRVAAGYALTNGPVANDIRASETLSPVDADDLVPDSALLMTATRGGDGSPSAERQGEIFRYLTTSRDRIYTREDIKRFCRAWYGDRFADVALEHDYEVSNRPKHGVVGTSKIILKGTGEQSAAGRVALAGDILAGLKRRSPEETEYRIVFEQ